MKELVEHSKQVKAQYGAEFQQVCGVPLHRFMHPLFGFGVVAFDEWLGTPDGISTHDYLLKTKGQAAVTLIYNLI